MSLEKSGQGAILRPVPDEKALVDLYKLHCEEVRFQVNLTWDRAKSSLAFHAAWIAIVANMTGKVEVRHLTPGMFLFAAASAVLGAVMVQLGHQNYRSARDQRKRVEELLGVSLGIVTTPGSRGETRRQWFRIYMILVLLHAMLAGLALGGALQTWSK